MRLPLLAAVMLSLAATAAAEEGPGTRGLFLLGAGAATPLGDLGEAYDRDLAVNLSGASRLTGVLGVHMHWTWQRFEHASGSRDTLWDLGLGAQVTLGGSGRVLPYLYLSGDLLQERLFGSSYDGGFSLGGGVAFLFSQKVGLAVDGRFTYDLAGGPGNLYWVTPTLNLVLRQ